MYVGNSILVASQNKMYNIIGSKLNVVFIVLCVLCSMYHVFTVIEEYYSGQVNKLISVKIKEDYEIPWMSLCFAIYDFREFVTFANSLINITHETHRNKIYMMLDGQVSLNQIYKILPKKEDIIESIDVAPKSINGSWIAPPVIVLPFFCEPFYCLAIGIDTEKPYTIYWHDSGIFEYGTTFYTVTLKRKSLVFHKEMYLFVHQHRTFLHKASMGSKKLFLRPKFEKYEFTLEQLKYSLLPYPYETDCLDYAQTGFQSRAHAYDMCVQSEARNVFKRNLPFSSANVTSQAYIGFKLFSQMKTNETLFSAFESIRYNCSRVYNKPDCKTTYFKITGDWVFKGAYQGIMIIKMVIINAPQVSMFSRKKMSLSQTIIYIGSILGIWFGFSIVNMAPKAYRFVIYFYNKYKTLSSELIQVNRSLLTQIANQPE